MKISARNVLPGMIVKIVRGPVGTEATPEISPGLQIVSGITTASAGAPQRAEGPVKVARVVVGAD